MLSEEVQNIPAGIHDPSCFTVPVYNVNTSTYSYADTLPSRLNPNAKPFVPTLASPRSVRQLNPDAFRQGLAGHPDSDFVDRLVYNCTHGVTIGYTGPRAPRISHNWPSTYEHAQAVQASIEKDIRYGVTVGPFASPPFSNFVGSPMGAFFKKRSHKVRVIHDLSWPPNSSINDYIDIEDYRVHYMSVDDVVDQIRILGPNCQIAKLDLEDAFKHIPVHPSDWELLGYTWYYWDPASNCVQPQYFFDRMIQFGARSSPSLFNEFADGAQFIMTGNGVTYVDHYLDDFITVGPADSDICSQNLQIMLDTCDSLGFSVNPRKVVPATSQLEFLGITLDSESMEISISTERMNDVMGELHKWRDRQSCTKRELLSLIGKLTFVSRVVKPGRTFVRRMIDLASRIKHLHYKVKLNKEFQCDVDWWLAYLPDWNGICMISPSQEDHHVFTDASDQAYAGYSAGDWFVNEFTSGTDVERSMSINWREMKALVTAAAVWGPTWHGKRVVFHCDNECVVHVVNSGTCKSPAIMALVRALFFISAQHEFLVHCVYINTKDNTIADALSRLDFVRFRREAPCAQLYPVHRLPTGDISC